MNGSVQQFYGNRLRVRVCGICIENDGLLLANHTELTAHDFWAPPGGGIEQSESANDCLVREFKEETGLVIEVCDFLFVCEFIKEPLHAIELFFNVKKKGGLLEKGIDPEAGDYQIIKEIRFLNWSEIENIDKSHLHGIFKFVEKPNEITQLRGYFKL